jgi:hypothetical protein
MAEKKKVINVRLVKGKRKATRRAKPKEKSKTKQKQKQKQVVNVQVSSGGSGGGGFIPVPQAPAFDYSLLANLIRPANTVDMPIRAMAPVPEPVQVRPAEAPTLVEAKTGGGIQLEGGKAEAEGIFAGIPKSFRIKKGESEQDAMVRYQQYLADKSERNRMATFEKRKSEVLSKIPVGEATAVSTPATAKFVGETADY